MSPSHPFAAVWVETEVEFTLVELSRVCSVDTALLEALVDEGALTPRGESPEQWRFTDTSLARAKAAVRLALDLQLNPAGAALVLDLLDEIEALKAQLRRTAVR